MRQDVKSFLDRLGIENRWLDHPAVFTVAEAMQHIEGKKPIKNLLLQEKNKGRKILVIMAGDKRLDTKAIANKLETRKLRFADPDTLKQTLGVTPGAVSIFGLLHAGSKGVEVAIDEAILKEPEIGFHPDDNTSTLFIAGGALEAIVTETGHRYLVMNLL